MERKGRAGARDPDGLGPGRFLLVALLCVASGEEYARAASGSYGIGTAHLQILAWEFLTRVWLLRLSREKKLDGPMNPSPTQNLRVITQFELPIRAGQGASSTSTSRFTLCRVC